MKIALVLIFTLFVTSSTIADAGPYGGIDRGYFDGYPYSFTVFQMSLVPGVQLFDSCWRPDVYGVSLGIVGIFSDVDVYGIRLCPFSYNGAKSCALAFSVWDIAGENYGLVLALLAMQSENCAISAGIVNSVGKSNSGLMLGIVNLAHGTYNKTPSPKDEPIVKPVKNLFQMGIVNLANHGLQLGLWNYNKNSMLPHMMLFNYSRKQ